MLITSSDQYFILSFYKLCLDLLNKIYVKVSSLACPSPGTTAWPGVSTSFQLGGEGSPLRQLACPRNLVNRLSPRQLWGRGGRYFLDRGMLFSHPSTRASSYLGWRIAGTQTRFFVKWNVNSDEKSCVRVANANFSRNTRHRPRILFARFAEYSAFLRAHETECLEFSLGRVNSVRALHFFANEKLGRRVIHGNP